MCPEFASGSTEKDRHTANTRHRNYRTSPGRTVARCSSGKSRDIVRRDYRDFSGRRTVLSDHPAHYSLRCDTYSTKANDRRPRTGRSSSPVSDYQHKDDRACGMYRSRSRSPGCLKSSYGTVGDRCLRTTGDSLANRNASNRTSLALNMAYRDSSSNNRSSAHTRKLQQTVQDHFSDNDSRYCRGQRHKEMPRPNGERECRSRYLYHDASNFSEQCMSGRTSSNRRSPERLRDVSSSPRRGLFSRRSRVDICEDVRYCERPSEYHGCRDCHQDPAALSDCGCFCSGDQRRPDSDFVCAHHDARLNRRDNSSVRRFSDDRRNSKLYVDRNDANGRSRTRDRSRSSPQSRYRSTEDRTVSTGLQHNHKHFQQQTGTKQEIRPSSEHIKRDTLSWSKMKNTDSSNCGSSVDGRSSQQQKQSDSSTDRLSSGSNMHKSDSVNGRHMANNHRTLPYSSQEVAGVSLSQLIQPSNTDLPHVISSTGNDKKHCSVVSTSSASALADINVDARSTAFSVSGYCPPSFAESAQTAVQCAQHWVTSIDPVPGDDVQRSQWPTSVVMAQHVTTDKQRLHDLISTAAVPHLPLLSTRMSAVATDVDPRKLGISQVSLDSSVNFTNLPSSISVIPTPVPPVGDRIGQYTLDAVYGDSPLLDEPSYHSPVASHDPTLNVLANNVSSVDYVQPEMMQPMNDTELKKMLDVVTVAKTTLEQTLPPGCHSVPNSLKQQQKLVNVERVADEVKSALKPFFLRNEIDKEEYKDIMRKAVPKIVSSKAGIDTLRIREFIANYVAKVKAAQKRAMAAKQHLVDQQTCANITAAAATSSVVTRPTVTDEVSLQ